MEPAALDLKSVLKTWLYLDDFDIGEPSPSLMVQEGDTCDVVPNTFICVDNDRLTIYINGSISWTRRWCMVSWVACRY